MPVSFMPFGTVPCFPPVSRMANTAVVAVAQTPSFPLFLRHFQAFLTPQTVHPFAIHAPPFVAQQRPYPTVAITRMATNQLVHSLNQRLLIVAFTHHVTLRRSRLIQHLASPTLRHFFPKRLAYCAHRFPAARRA